LRSCTFAMSLPAKSILSVDWAERSKLMSIELPTLGVVGKLQARNEAPAKAPKSPMRMDRAVDALDCCAAVILA